MRRESRRVDRVLRARAAAAMVATSAFAFAPGPAPGQEAENAVALVGGFLIDGTEGVPLQNSVVLVEGERVVHVGTVDDTPIPSGFRVVDANGLTVMPGMHEAHAHLFIVGHGVYSEYFTRYHYEQDRMRELMAVSARQLIMAGVTSARDVGAELEDALWLRDEIESGRLEGPRLLVSGPFLQKTTSAPQEFFRIAVNGPDDARRQARRLVDAGVDLLKIIQLADLSRDERLAMAEVAHEAGIHIAVHASTTEEVRAAAEMGVRTIEHVGGGSSPLYPLESIELMVENGIFWVPTAMVSKVYDVTDAFPERLDAQQLRADLPGDVWEDVRGSLSFRSRLGYFTGKREVSGDYAAKIRQAYDAGVRLLIGTDSGTPMNFHYETTWQEMDLFVRYGIPPMRVISMATRYPALAYGQLADWGTIEPGRLADIILLNGNPLRSMSALAQNQVIYVFKGGVQYKGPGSGPSLSAR